MQSAATVTVTRRAAALTALLLATYHALLLFLCWAWYYAITVQDGVLQAHVNGGGEGLLEILVFAVLAAVAGGLVAYWVAALRS